MYVVYLVMNLQTVIVLWAAQSYKINRNAFISNFHFFFQKVGVSSLDTYNIILLVSRSVPIFFVLSDNLIINTDKQF